MTTENTQRPARVAAAPSRVYRPRFDVLEHGDRYVLRIDVPGAAADAVAVSFDDGVLTIHAPVARRGEARPTDEYVVGDWRISIRFNDLVDPEAIAASQTLGVLEVVLPKSKARQHRRIDVSVN